MPNKRAQPENEVFGIIDKSSREQIWVQRCELDGHIFIDVRTYWRLNRSEEWRPSQKGVTLKPRLVHELIAALEKAEVREFPCRSRDAGGADGDDPVASR